MAEKLPESIEFHYLKSNSFRVVHSDGVWGGTTLRGYITMSFYSERMPIPRKITHEVKQIGQASQVGQLGDEISRESRQGVIREIEVEVLMDLEMAKSLIPWLQEKIDALEKTRPPQLESGERPQLERGN